MFVICLVHSFKLTLPDIITIKELTLWSPANRDSRCSNTNITAVVCLLCKRRDVRHLQKCMNLSPLKTSSILNKHTVKRKKG